MVVVVKVIDFATWSMLAVMSPRRQAVMRNFSRAGMSVSQAVPSKGLTRLRM